MEHLEELHIPKLVHMKNIVDICLYTESLDTESRPLKIHRFYKYINLQLYKLWL